MAHNIKSVCNFWSHPLMKLIFWILILAGLYLYMWSIVILAQIPIIYPTLSRLFGAALTSHFSFMVLLFWMPASNFLINSGSKKYWIPGLFIIGCTVALIMSSLTIFFLEPYTLWNFTREEYFRTTGAAVSVNQKEIPSWVGNVKSHNCCSWFGPYDFGVALPTWDRKSFIDSLSQQCFYDFVTQSTGSKLRAVPEGCGMMIKKKVKEFCEDLYVTAVFVIIMTFLTIIVYLYHFWRILKSPDEDIGYPAEQMTYSQQISIETKTNPNSTDESSPFAQTEPVLSDQKNTISTTVKVNITGVPEKIYENVL